MVLDLQGLDIGIPGRYDDFITLPWGDPECRAVERVGFLEPEPLFQHVILVKSLRGLERLSGCRFGRVAELPRQLVAQPPARLASAVVFLWRSQS